MDRKREITNDLWDIFRKVYCMPDQKHKSEKQEELLTKIVEYIDTNLSTRRKTRQSGKEKESVCLSEPSK